MAVLRAARAGVRRASMRIRSRRRLRRIRGGRHLLLDVGGSTPGWISLDIEPTPDGIRMDASKPWPLPGGCARAIRSEHMIEHLDWPEAQTFVREIFRVLEPGGLVRICTPDLQAISHAYVARTSDVLDAHRIDYLAPTWAHLPNNLMRMWRHRFLFDFDALSSVLQDAGFEGIERRGFNESSHAIFVGHDSHVYDGELAPLSELTLTVDAVKPPR